VGGDGRRWLGASTTPMKGRRDLRRDGQARGRGHHRRDHSKFEQRALTVFAQWTEIDPLRHRPATLGSAGEALRDAGTEVIVAQR